MAKRGPEDIFDCAACGYGSCESMAIAIHNGLNKPENCHHYQQELILQDQKRERELALTLNQKIVYIEGRIRSLNDTMSLLSEASMRQAATIEESSTAIESMMNSIGEASAVSTEKRKELDRVTVGTREGSERLDRTNEAIVGIREAVGGIGEISSAIADISEHINLLSMNAAIEAAHAGAAGRGFAVIASEVKKLAEASAENSGTIAKGLGGIEAKIVETSRLSLEANQSVLSIMSDMASTSSGVASLLNLLEETASGSSQLKEAIRDMRDLTVQVHGQYESIAQELSGITLAIGGIREASDAGVTQG
jgi:methyl-accepting chemotaxis protein